MIDGAPIVAIATQASKNAKTGAMIQTWIIRQDIAPHIAIKTGADASICGDCKHRGIADGSRAIGRSCYVLTHNAPRSIWEKFTRGGYDAAADLDEIEALGTGEAIRLGSYGDPAAVPVEIWQALTRNASRHTGYTHQWHRMSERVARAWRPLVMASADTRDELDRARSAGWRTFRVADDQAPGEILCPASKEAGQKTTCAKCSLCSGTTGPLQVTIYIPAHGFGATHARKRVA